MAQQCKLCRFVSRSRQMSTHPEFWRLDGASTTLLVLLTHSVPRLYWCGKRLAHDVDLDSLLVHENNALAYAGLDEPNPLTLFPEASTGYCGSPALSGHRDGKQFAQQLVVSGVVESSDAQGEHLEIGMVDANAGLKVSMRLSLDHSSDVARMVTTLTNTGSTPYTVDWLASGTLPLPCEFDECLTQHGRWGRENQAYRRPIGPGRLDISNLHGRTSHEHAPSLICGTPGFNENTGGLLYAHLAWSGNFSLRVERLSDGLTGLQAGVLLLPGEGRLEAEESMVTPPLVFTRGDGMNECTQRFHEYARAKILPGWTRSERPIHANSWEALYFDHDVDALISLIDAAASVGAERFVLDDGWFPARRLDNAGLGDWFVDKTIYPDGLHPIVNRVRLHGMQFGLWFEPEMVNPDSELYRNHPEWALHLDGIDTPLARNQQALDISREDVSDYLFNCITALVKEYEIDYIKWDQNRDLVLAGDGGRARAAAQPRALYALLDRILQACPDLQIESCASGGARCDLAILEHTGRVWTSDNIDPVERATIQQGFMHFFPPEIMGAHVGHRAAHLTGRVTSLHTRAVLALQGQFGFEIDARVFDPHDVVTLQHYTELYKRNRGWLAAACFWQLPTVESSLIASGLVSADGQRAWFSVVTTSSLHLTRPGRLRLLGLDARMRYTLNLESINLQELAPFNKIIPNWCDHPVITSGELLMNLGVPLPVMPPQSALLISCVLENSE